jgi:transmembrane sensor
LKSNASAASSAQECAFSTLEQAAEWFAVLRSGAASDDEKARWQAWLDVREENRLAWQRVESISNGLSLPKMEPAAANAALDAAALQRRRAIKMLSLLAVTGLTCWEARNTYPVQTILAGFNADYRSAVGEVRDLTLADGTRLWLNTDSALDEHYDERIRRVKLRKGEVMIATNPDDRSPARPFIIESAEGSLRALGTRFNVRQLEGKTRLSVFEGRVEIVPRDPDAASKIIESGEQVDFTRNEIMAVMPAGSTSEAWTQGLLVADNMPLGELVTELARYRSGYLACDPAIAQLRVVGGFPLKRPDQALAMLEASLPIQVHRTMPWWVTVRAR